MRRNLAITGLVLVALSAAGCGGTKSSSSSPTPSGAKGSVMACGHWANVRGDVKAGILTDSELRSKVSEVRDSAASADVRTAATELLAGITSGKKDRILSGYAALNSACA